MPEAQADACEQVANELVEFWDADIQAELRVVLGTRHAGDRLESIASRWVAVRAQECELAKRDNRPPHASPCSASVREQLNVTISTLRTPAHRKGVEFDRVIGELPKPEHCLEHPDDANYGRGGLAELRHLDLELAARLAAVVTREQFELAEQRSADYMHAARELGAAYDIARAIHWRAELHRLRGRPNDLERAEADFERAYAEALALGANEFAGEAMLKLAAIAAAKGDLLTLEVRVFVAASTFAAHHRPDKLAELAQVHGLALIDGDPAQPERGLAILREAVELCEAQQARYGGTQEKLGWALEALARGLLAAGEDADALAVVERALAMHQADRGGEGRLYELRRLLFVAQVGSARLDDAFQTSEALLYMSDDGRDWTAYVNEALWVSSIYQAANLPSQAAQVLTSARQLIPAAHGRSELSREVEMRLNEITSGAITPRRQGK